MTDKLILAILEAINSGFSVVFISGNNHSTTLKIQLNKGRNNSFMLQEDPLHNSNLREDIAENITQLSKVIDDMPDEEETDLEKWDVAGVEQRKIKRTSD